MERRSCGQSPSPEGFSCSTKVSPEPDLHLRPSCVALVNTDPQKEPDMSKRQNLMNRHSVIQDAAVHRSSTLTLVNKAIDTATCGVECTQTTGGRGLHPARLQAWEMHSNSSLPIDKGLPSVEGKIPIGSHQNQEETSQISFLPQGYTVCRCSYWNGDTGKIMKHLVKTYIFVFVV